MDISDPANPKRLDAVSDPLFAYWHGATFSNDGTKVVFTDEWGGGTAARVRGTRQAACFILRIGLANLPPRSLLRAAAARV